MSEEKKYTIEELKQFFRMLDDLKKKANQIAPLCTNINSQEEITGIWLDDGPRRPYVSIGVWSHNCGNDAYDIPLEYFSMTKEEVEKTEKEKAELERRRLAMEEKREAERKKKAREQRERREYERLKKKFG